MKTLLLSKGAAALGMFLFSSPLAIVIVLSLVIGLFMVVLFGWTSDQKAIKIAKDQLKAHLLAVRLFQDQLPVVVGAYGKIIRGTGRYIRLAFMPLLYVILPLTALIVYLDHYLGYEPFAPTQSFLVKVQAAPETLNDVQLELPSELKVSAPAVHIPADNEVIWRVVAEKPGSYDVKVAAGGQSFVKQVVVSDKLEGTSLARLRDHFWERMFTSLESALPARSPVQSIAVTYPTREIRFAWIDWNWILLFFVLSMIAGFGFKELLGIEI
jgi:hypothetical protein